MVEILKKVLKFIWAFLYVGVGKFKDSVYMREITDFIDKFKKA